jgi:hypothetical protein
MIFNTSPAVRVTVSVDFRTVSAGAAGAFTVLGHDRVDTCCRSSEGLHCSSAAKRARHRLTPGAEHRLEPQREGFCPERCYSEQFDDRNTVFSSCGLLQIG